MIPFLTESINNALPKGLSMHVRFLIKDVNLKLESDGPVLELYEIMINLQN